MKAPDDPTSVGGAIAVRDEPKLRFQCPVP